MSFTERFVGVTEREYRKHIGDPAVAHARKVTQAREAVARLRTAASVENVAFANSVWGPEFTPTIQRALRTEDETLLSQVFYEPVVALLISVHREAFEESVGEATAELLVGPGKPFPDDFSVVIGRADGRCMAVLKEFTDPHCWNALYRWAWRYYGATSETVVELRAVA